MDVDGGGVMKDSVHNSSADDRIAENKVPTLDFLSHSRGLSLPDPGTMRPAQLHLIVSRQARMATDEGPLIIDPYLIQIGLNLDSRPA